MPFVKIAKATLGQKLTSKTSEFWMWAPGSRFSLTKLMLAGITKSARRRSYAQRFMFALTKPGASRCTSKRRRSEFGAWRNVMRFNCAPPQDSAPPQDGLAWNRSTATIALLSFAMLIVSLDQYIVVVALPEIGRDLGYAAQTLPSVISAYAIASSGFLLFGGRAADLLGRRRLLVTGLALYGLASLAGGVATGPRVQLAARAVQGLGGALVFPSTLALINTTFREGRDRNRALSIWGGAGAVGLVVGVLLGGVLTRAFGWQAVFFVNVPLAGAALVLAFPLIEVDQARDRSRAFDLPGAVSATAAITSLVFGLVQGPEIGWGSPRIVVALAVGLVLLAAFVLIERRSRDPLVPPRLLANPVLMMAVAIGFMFMFTFGSLLYFLSIYFQ